MNPKSGRLFAILAVLAGAIGCSSATDKRAADKDSMTVYVLDPVPIRDPQHKKHDKGEEDFNGFAVLGKVDISSEKNRKEILDAIEKGMKGGNSAKCFDPRHGVRNVHGETVTDYVICFECQNVAIHGTGHKDEGLHPIDDTPHAVLDRHLKEMAPKK